MKTNKQAKIVIHRHNRSSSRASNSSAKAKRTLSKAATMVQVVKDTAAEYDDAVERINSASK